MSENLNILDVNLEKLEPIVEHEVNIEDQLNLVVNHANSDVINHKPDLFKTICQQAAKKDKPADWRCVLECCGKSINHIYDGGYCMTAETFALAQKFCPELKTINISLTRDNLQYVQSYLPQWKELEEVELRGPAFIESLLWSLSKLPNLQKLSLWDFDCETSGCIALNFLTQLKHLEISHLESGFPRKISTLLRNLISLNVYTNADKETCCELAEYCSKLENLYLYDHKENESWSIDYFNNLKCLEVHDQNASAFFLLNSLDQRYNYQLQKLIIPGKCIYQKEAMRIAKLKALKSLSCVLPDVRCLKYFIYLRLEELSLYNCCNLKNDHLLFTMHECKTLRSLKITLCTMITPHFIKDALEILFRNGVKPQNPFELMIRGSGMSTSDVDKMLSSHPHSSLLNLTLN
ncbi:uncharacterized protein LOC117788519 [Drosophila innubila]|uniref:uncharacterized protein LOC117788519 n=1 Tax=Drosophila innubila TaxID=198719 RepID=UPI00148D6844|nr:uncharacterized protein LOC117788519 [Drosophila innubila]